MDRRGRAGEVVDLVHLDKQRVRYVVPHRLEMRVAEQAGDIVLPPGEVIIDAEHVVALGAQPLAEIIPRESGAAGDEYPFHDSTHYDDVPWGVRALRRARIRRWFSG